jgi:UDP-glucose 4-epimerase
MRILVSGGCGFIGSHIVDTFIRTGHHVLALDNMSTGNKSNLHPIASLCECDITNYEDLRNVFSDFLPDVVIHQAAQPSLLISWESAREDAEINIVGTLNMFDLAEKFNSTQFVMASTSAVFGDETMFAREDTETDPRSPYGLAKNTCEKYLRMLVSSMQVAVLRYGNVYGPRQVPIGENQLIARLFSHIYKKTPFCIYGDGSSERDYVYVSDVAEANLAVVEHSLGGILHVGSGISRSTNDVVAYVCKEVGYDPGSIENIPAKDERKSIVLKSCRTDWKRMWIGRIPLQVGIASTNSWWKANKEL